MWKGWVPGAVAMLGIFAWFGVDDRPPGPPPCAGDVDCAEGEHCVAAHCEPKPPPGPIRLAFADGRAREPVQAPCGDGVCDLGAGECDGACPGDCPDVPCSLPCALDGVCMRGEGATCPDCYPAGCNFDALCTVGESPRCPDCSCGDGYCDTSAGECASTCPADCPGTRCTAACDFDAACERGEADGCPDCSCGDDYCDPVFEDCEICAHDCGTCPSGCGDGVCSPDDGPNCADCVPEACDPHDGCGH